MTYKLRLLTFISLIFVLLFVGKSLTIHSKKQGLELTQKTEQPPVIRVQNQPNSPLQISFPRLDAGELLNPIYSYLLTNTGNRPIRAFAVKADVVFGKKAKSSGAVLSNLPSLDSLLQPGQSKRESEGGNSKYSAPVNEIVLSIDFIEFADGATWGNDEFSSSENLAGQRAGGRTTIEYFKEKIRRGEIDSVVREIEGVNNVQIDNANRSRIWREGFRSGIGLVRNRLKRARNRLGAEDIIRELEKPFDASDGRREK